MNYYEKNLGDYARDAGHLSQAQHGAYNLLMDYYYATESGINSREIFSITKSKTKAERLAATTVIEKFFYLDGNVYRKNRIEEEIAKYHVRIESSRKNGKKGGRPATKTQSKPTGLSETKPGGFIPVTILETGMKAHHTPYIEPLFPTTTKPENLMPVNTGLAGESRPSTLTDIDPITQRAIELSILLRRGGAALTGSDPYVRRWAETGISDAQALTALETALASRASTCSTQPINSGYLHSILTGKSTEGPLKPAKTAKPENYDAKQYGENRDI